MGIRDYFSFLCVYIPVVCIIVFIATAITYCVNIYDCNSYSEVTGRETKAVNLGCYVKHNYQWYSKDEYKHVRLDK